MSNPIPMPDRDAVKTQAKRLRTALVAEGNFVSHSESLELVAKQYGYRDWNTLSAALGEIPEREVKVGGVVTGRYLGHRFRGRVLGLQVFKGHRRRIVVEFDEPIDVVTSEHFSGYRRRAEGVIEKNGATWQKLSDGTPLLAVDL